MSSSGSRSSGSNQSSSTSNMSYEQSVTRKHRVPDNDNKYITSKSANGGKVKIIDHKKSIYDPAAPSPEYRTPRDKSSSHRSSGK